MVRVAPEPVEELAGRLDEVGLRLSELSCRARAVGSALGCVPAAGRLSEVGLWCDGAADDLRVLSGRARQIDEQAASQVSAAGLGGPWESPGSGRDHVGEAAGGAWDALTSTAEAFNGLTVQLLWDPVGWWRDWGEVGEGLVFSVAHPGEAARAAIDLDTLDSNPARWTGQLVPDRLGGVVTGGATVGARRTTDAVDTLGDLGRTVDRVPDGDRPHLAPMTIGWAASTGHRLDRYISTLPLGKSKAEHIRVVPDLEHMERLVAKIRARTVAGPHPRHADATRLTYPDGTRVGIRISKPHGLTIDVETVDDRYWKVHIHGS